MQMQFVISMDSESPEYQELAAIIGDLKKDGVAIITEQQYISNIVTNWLETRVRDTYHAKVRSMPVGDIQQTLGDYRAARSAVVRSKQ